MTQPLRREIRLPIYWLVVGLLVMVVSPILSIVVSAKINARTIEQNDQAKAVALAEVRVRTCRLIGAQADVYSEAETPVGVAAYRAWLEEYTVQGCLPRK